MNIHFDVEHAILRVDLTPGEHKGFVWNESRTYASAHDATRGRVGAILIPHHTGKPLRVEGLGDGEEEVVIVLRRLPYENTVRLDRYVSLDFDGRGVVTAVRFVR